MKRVRVVVLACRWETVPPAFPNPTPIAAGVLQQMFSESANVELDGGWSLADFWVRSTLGQIRFNSAVIFDIGALPGTVAGQLGGGSRGQVINQALQIANSQGIAFAANDVPIVFVNPPPSDAGAWGNKALLDQAAEHTYYAHEVGHTIGYGHSFGSDLTGDQNTEYGDRYCIMSARTFGGTWPVATGPPPGIAIPNGLPGPMWNGSGPLAAAASSAHFIGDFAGSSNVVAVSPNYHESRQFLWLSAVGDALQSDAVVARIDTGIQTFFVEYRAAVMWDRGLLRPGVPDPAIVIHRRRLPSNVIAYAAAIPVPWGIGQNVWAAPDDDVRVEVIASAGPPTNGVGLAISGFFGKVLALPGWFGAEDQGAGIAIADINGSGRPDLVVFHVDNPGGENHGYYRIGWDLNANGQATAWSQVLAVPGWFGAEDQGAGIAIADINGSGRPDLAVFHVDNPGGENHGYYRIGWDLNANGQATAWSQVLAVPGWFGAEDQGAGIAIADINGSGRPDLAVFHVDNPGGENHGYYRIGWDLNANGQATAWSQVLAVPGWFGAEDQGAGIAIADINGSGRPDLAVFHVDNPGGENHGYYRIGYDLDANGAPARWTSVIRVPGWFGAENHEADIALADIGGTGSPDLVVFHVDNPSGENHGYYRIGTDLSRR